MEGTSRFSNSPWLTRVVPIAILIFTVVAAFYQLSESPSVWYDEGFFEQAAMNLASHGEQVIQLVPGHYLSSWSVSAGYPLIAPIALMFKLFGVSVWNARAVPATYIVLFVLTAYVFVRREFGVLSATIVALLLATFPLLYGNGKSVLGEVPALFYFALMLLALQWLEQSRYKNNLAAFLTGMFAGLSFAAKFTFMLVPAALGVVALIRGRTLVRELPIKNWVLGASGFLLSFGVWVLLQFQPGDSVSTVLAFFANPYDYGTTALSEMMLQNLLRFVTEITPLYMLVLFAIWTISIALRKRKDVYVSTAELVSFSFTVLVLLAYLRTPGWYRYFFPAMVVSLLYFPQSLSVVWSAFQTNISFLSRLRWLPYVGLTLLILIQGYQLGWHSYVAMYYGDTRTAALTEYFSHVPPTESIFLYNVPEIAVFLPTTDFAQYLNPHVNQGFGADELPLIAHGIPTMIIVNAESYEIEKNVFSAYSVKDHVVHYVVLVRKPK